MCMGQLLEIEWRHRIEASEEDYTMLIRYKTGELISAACQVGAMGAGGTQAQAEALGDYGMKIGLAFQIVDDLLDIVSSNDKLGKPVGNDLREGKVTLPYIRTLSVAESADRKHLAALLSEGEPSAQIIEEAISIVHKYDGITYSQDKARQYVQAAKQALTPIPKSQHKAILTAMADFVVMRDR
jgi:geranylgeranyl pyrophosphate synthase